MVFKLIQAIGIKLELEEKEVLAEVFKQQIIALKPILKKNK